MGFTITHDVPSTETTVTVKFAGLILLAPDGANGCNVGIHRLSPVHLFQAILIIDKPGLPPTLLRLIHGHLQSEFTIAATRDGAWFRAFELDESDFDPNNTGNDPLDHRWAINMWALHPHARYTEDATPIAKLNDGVLYTSNLTSAELNPVLKKGNEERRLFKIAADLAVALDVPVNTTVRLSWTEDGVATNLELPRQGDPSGTTYTLMLVNDPQLYNTDLHDELGLFYDVLQDENGPIPSEERWILEYDDPSKSDEIPCMPVELNPPG